MTPMSARFEGSRCVLFLVPEGHARSVQQVHNKQLRAAATSVGEGTEMRQAAENDTPEQDLKRQRTVRRGPSGGPAQGGNGIEQT